MSCTAAGAAAARLTRCSIGRRRLRLGGEPHGDFAICAADDMAAAGDSVVCRKAQKKIIGRLVDTSVAQLGPGCRDIFNNAMDASIAEGSLSGSAGSDRETARALFVRHGRHRGNLTSATGRVFNETVFKES